MAQNQLKRFVLGLFVFSALTGCGEGKGPFAFAAKAGDTARAGSEAAPKSATRLVERDVEAPEVFQVADQGLWDGRPSLGGIWVAHPTAKDPERVIIRNEATGDFVIGALFRRERDFPGPKFQVSSDAAAALGLLAGAPARLHVTALRREELPMTPAAEAPPAPPPAAAPPAAGTPAAAAPKAPEPAAAKPRGETLSTSAAKPGKLEAPYIQIGIFAVEENAKKAAADMNSNGLQASLRKSEIGGKSYWRVLVGPADSAASRADGLTKVKALGYTDSYAVKG